MIILDTNVLSALMQQQSDPKVVAWLDDQPAESVWINSITLFEARYGLALLAAGQRKDVLQNALINSCITILKTVLLCSMPTPPPNPQSWLPTARSEADPSTYATPSFHA